MKADPNKEYIHFGNSHYNPDLVKKQRFTLPNKPDIGLWASPLDSSESWEQWCLMEKFNLERLKHWFVFTLKPDTHILEIHDDGQILPYIDQEYRQRMKADGINIQRLSYPFSDKHGLKTTIMDQVLWEEVYKDYDGIEYFQSDNYIMHYGLFNAWDCDSLCIWNPDKVVTMHEGETRRVPKKGVVSTR